MAESIDLVYPLYLDVPMMTSFVAALEDGIAYGSDVTQINDQRRNVAAEGEGKAGVGLPSMGILSTLLNFDLKGKITGDQEIGSGEEIKLVRRHTEASLFMRLRQMLKDDDRVLQINEIDDVQKLKDADHDYLVEVKGQIFRSPLSEALEAVFRILDMLGVDLSGNQPSRKQQTGGKKRGKGQQHAASQPAELALDNETQLGFQLMQRIREDLAKANILDAVMHPSTVGNLTIVIALALEFLPEGVFENLLSGNFSVLGKVTKIVEGDEEISLYQRTVFSYLGSSDIDASFTQLRQESSLMLSDNPSSVKAPALQLSRLQSTLEHFVGFSSSIEI